MKLFNFSMVFLLGIGFIECSTSQTYYLTDKHCNTTQQLNNQKSVIVRTYGSYQETNLTDPRFCNITIKPAKDLGLVLTWHGKHDSSGNCDENSSDYMIVKVNGKSNYICSATRAQRLIMNTNPNTNVTLIWNSSLKNAIFTITATPYRLIPRKTFCHHHEFQCYRAPSGNRKCIAGTLRCNGENNCGDNSDEYSYYAGCSWIFHMTSFTKFLIISGCLMVVVFIVAAVAGLCSCKKRRRRPRSGGSRNRTTPIVAVVSRNDNDGDKPPPPPFSTYDPYGPPVGIVKLPKYEEVCANAAFNNINNNLTPVTTVNPPIIGICNTTTN